MLSPLRSLFLRKSQDVDNIQDSEGIHEEKHNEPSEAFVAACAPESDAFPGDAPNEQEDGRPPKFLDPFEVWSEFFEFFERFRGWICEV